jgi:SAM-dependent methyltransferase
MKTETYPSRPVDHADQTLNRTAISATPDSLAANAANNARGDGARRRRWKPARAAAWALLDGEVACGARVAVAGAGNGDDLPLLRLARRAGRLDLIDLDARALAGARRRAIRARALEQDLTGGAADAVLAGVAPPVAVPATPIGDGPYDVVVCDLVLTQLLYPALKAAGRMTGAQIDAVLLRDGQRITDGVVARLHAAAPGGTVVVLHDLLGWWDGHRQPFTLDELLAGDPAAALTLARRGSLPYGCDPWLATERAGAHVTRTALWRWPFAPGADYAVFGLVTRRRR